MKTTIAMLCVLSLFACLATATAAQKTNAPVAAKAAAPELKAPKTPSQPRSIRTDGAITDGPVQLVVISNEAIKRSGRGTLVQVLAQRQIGR